MEVDTNSCRSEFVPVSCKYPPSNDSNNKYGIFGNDWLRGLAWRWWWTTRPEVRSSSLVKDELKYKLNNLQDRFNELKWGFLWDAVGGGR